MGVLPMSGRYERILIPTDGSDCSARAVEEGVCLAKEGASLVTLLYVLDDEESTMERGSERLRRDANVALHHGHVIASRHGVIVTDRIALGAAVKEIVREAEGFDLVVMGSHGRGFLTRIAPMGSVAEGVVMQLCRPVLIVPPSSGTPEIARGPN